MLQQQTQPADARVAARPFGARFAGVSATLRRAYAANRSLTILGVLMIFTMFVSLAGLLLDPRVITGAPAWLKPFKFAVSITIYSFTLLWILGFVEGKRWLVRTVSVVTAVGLAVEMIIVIVQVVRGTTSHFNVATPLDGALFSTMGLIIVVIWVMTLIATLLLLFQRLPDPAFAWALRLGLLLTLIGAASGFLMTRPTAAQRAGMAASQPMTVVGAHSVGVADGGPGLPITGWSTTGGDLRIGHFVGLHALQALPLIGWLLMRRRMRRLGDGRRVALIWIAGLAYAGLMGLMIWQALRGQPLLAPDATTLAALAGLLGATALALGAVLLPRLRRPHASVA
jgi:hypothetical protein